MGQHEQEGFSNLGLGGPYDYHLESKADAPTCMNPYKSLRSPRRVKAAFWTRVDRRPPAHHSSLHLLAFACHRPPRKACLSVSKGRQLQGGPTLCLMERLRRIEKGLGQVCALRLDTEQNTLQDRVATAPHTASRCYEHPFGSHPHDIYI